MRAEKEDAGQDGGVLWREGWDQRRWLDEKQCEDVRPVMVVVDEADRRGRGAARRRRDGTGARFGGAESLMGTLSESESACQGVGDGENGRIDQNANWAKNEGRQMDRAVREDAQPPPASPELRSVPPPLFVSSPLSFVVSRTGVEVE
jgi:hypothetical protein